MTDEERRINAIFFPHATEQQERIRNSGTKFVHYTNADAAVGILRDKEVWMRNAMCMNDFMEVEHGLQCVAKAYNGGENGKRLKEILNNLFQGLAKELEDYYNGWQPSLKLDTYFSCFSEHDHSEDTFGRLSMWRGYGQGTGVAFVFKSEPFFMESDALKAYASPVAYLDDSGFDIEFKRVIDAMDSSIDIIKAMKRDELKNCIFNVFMFAALCTKHPGFREEKEWRIFYAPSYQKSDVLSDDIKIIQGAPQTIYKIPLKNLPDKGLTGIEIPEFIDKIIIGPSDYPVPIKKAFVDLLTKAGVKDADNKVLMSDIPLRR